MIHSCYLITTQSHIHMCHVSEKFIICFAWLRQQFKLRPVAKTLLFCFCVCVYILLLFLCRTSQSAICILNAKQTHFIHWCDEFWLNTNAIAIRSHANINVEVANRLIYFSNSMGLRLLESFQQKLSLDSLDGHQISMSRIPLGRIFFFIRNLVKWFDIHPKPILIQKFGKQILSVCHLFINETIDISASASPVPMAIAEGVIHTFFSSNIQNALAKVLKVHTIETINQILQVKRIICEQRVCVYCIYLVYYYVA